MPVFEMSSAKWLVVAVLLVTGTACSPPASEVSISFAAAYNGQPVSCIGNESEVQLTDLRFYVHDVNLVADDGSLQQVSLIPDGIWQDETVALVDLETGEGACLNGTAETHTTIIGHYAGDGFEGVQFAIGVPDDLNHKDPLIAEPPLSYSVMHWHWASGYKFIRAGIENTDDSVFLHLGSSRCEGTIGDIKGCGSANRPVVVVGRFDPNTDQVVIDLGTLFQSTDLADGEKSECMSGPANPACVGPFSQLGVDHATGESIAPAAAFSAGLRR